MFKILNKFYFIFIFYFACIFVGFLFVSKLILPIKNINKVNLDVNKDIPFLQVLFGAFCYILLHIIY